MTCGSESPSGESGRAAASIQRPWWRFALERGLHPITHAERPVLHRWTCHEDERLVDHGLLDEDDLKHA